MGSGGVTLSWPCSQTEEESRIMGVLQEGEDLWGEAGIGVEGESLGGCSRVVPKGI